MITLVLGGARSGKSVLAERLASHHAGPVTYVATSCPQGDADLSARIAAHQARRPRSWATVEAHGSLVEELGRLQGTVLVDSLGTWVASCPQFDVDVAGLCTALTARAGDTVVVSDEVGMGVHPSTEVGRRFRDALGEVNRRVADVADEVLRVVAGRALVLESLPRVVGAGEDDQGGAGEGQGGEGRAGEGQGGGG